MQEVKLSTIDTAQKFLVGKVNIFEKKHYPKLNKILSTSPQKVTGLNFCGDAAFRKQLADVFKELHKNKWTSGSGSFVSTKSDTLQGLKETIKNIKGITIKRKFSSEKDTKVRTEKLDFAQKFLDYIRNALRYEKQKKIEKIKVEDSQIEIAKGQGYANPPENLLNFGESSWTPTVADVKQGRAGDCYLLAALLSLISKDPNAIKKCFVNRATLKTDDHVKIRFFKVKLEEHQIHPNPAKIVAKPKEKVVIKIKKTILMQIDPQTNQPVALIKNQIKEALWVNFIEKAFMVYKSKNCVGTKFTGNEGIQKALAKWNTPGLAVSNLDSGLSFIAFTAITGKPASMAYLPDSGGKKFPVNATYSPEATKIYTLFESEIRRGKMIAVATKNGDFPRKTPKGKSTTIWTDKNGNPKNYPGLVGRHSYAVVENVEEGVGPLRNTETGKFDGTVGGNFKFVWLQNPHAKAGFDEYIKDLVLNGKLKRKDEYTGGKLRMELNDFLKYFSCYDVVE